VLSRQLTHRTLIRYDKEIGHLFVPNVVMRQPFIENPHFVRTNKQGFRSNFDYKRSNDNGEIRIAFLGDSCTAGEGVANEKRFSDLVADALGAKCYNFALSASGVDQQYLIYKNIACDFHHDVLVISPHIIDIYRNVLDARISVEGRTGKEILVPKPYFKLKDENLVQYNVPVPVEREIVNGYSRREAKYDPGPQIRHLFHKYCPKRLKEEILKVQFSDEHDGYEMKNHPRWMLMGKLLSSVIEEAGNIPIVLAPLPYHRIHMNPKFKERFLELSEEYPNVVFADILDRFKSVSNTDDLNFKQDSHYSEYGNEVVADEIIDVIRKNKLIKEPGSEIKKSIFSAKTETKKNYILGISAFYHDSACALICDGALIAAAQEERFTRKKNDPGFPRLAINYCLEEAQIDIEDVDEIVFYDNPYLTFERILVSMIKAYPKGSAIWEEVFPKWVQTKLNIPEIIREALNYKKPIQFTLHHLSHAASAYYPSPFSKAAILTIDGVGEWSTATICMGEGKDIKMIKTMNFPDSVGLLYSAFTYYTGFKVNEGEYKLMGLAPYGEPRYVELIRDNIAEIFEDGSIKLNQSFFGYQDDLKMINKKFEQLFGGPARNATDPITQRIRDIARSIQVVVEDIVLKMAKHAKDITGAENLCLAGGVALNCVSNGKLLRSKLFDDIWIQPASGDSGGALGAALALYYQKYGNEMATDTVKTCQKASLLGPSFSDGEIKAQLESFNYKYKTLKSGERNQMIAKYLSEGKIVGHFSGRMEYGPRALGARSILADARNETAQSTLNLKIKFRESFRPFAPSVLEEDIATYFELDRPSPYMMIVASVNTDRQIHNTNEYEHDIIEIVNQKRSDLPAITHVDYSARIQSVSREDNPNYHDLISEFKKLTGYGVIINTSFNVNGEPIICTPRDAVRCFMKTNIDILVLNNYILFKSDQKESELDKIEFTGLEEAVKPNNKKIKKEALKMYHKFFPDLYAERSLFKEYKESSSLSNWIDFSETESNSIFSENMQQKNAEEVLKHWKVIDHAKMPTIRKFLDKFIVLSQKYKLDPDEIENSVSQSMYVMF
jgi:carbamoyltransferase